MIPIIGLSLVVQVLTAVHVVRNGRNQMWLMVILFFSLPGCFAYLVFEVLPGRTVNRHVRLATKQVGRKINPEGALRQARADLEHVDSVANRIALGDALADLDRCAEAADAYRDALARAPGEDGRTTMKLCEMLYETGAYGEALKQLDALSPAIGSEADRRTLLRARLLAATGDTAEARLAFEDVIGKLPGDGARCHYAAFLIEQGDRSRARSILEEVAERAARMDRVAKLESAQMYRWADEQLKELKA